MNGRKRFGRGEVGSEFVDWWEIRCICFEQYKKPNPNIKSGERKEKEKQFQTRAT